jgi:hypothetical protein
MKAEIRKAFEVAYPPRKSPAELFNSVGEIEILGMPLFVRVRPLIAMGEHKGRLSINVCALGVKYRRSIMEIDASVAIEGDGSNPEMLFNRSSRFLYVKGGVERHSLTKEFKAMFEDALMAAIPTWLDGHLIQVNERQLAFARHWADTRLEDSQNMEAMARMLLEEAAKLRDEAKIFIEKSESLLPSYAKPKM